MSQREEVTLLIDADIVAFQAAAVAQQKFDWGDGATSLHITPLENVLPKVDEVLAGFMADLKADKLIICLSCPTEENYRLAVLPTYKGQRDYSSRPVHLAAIKDYMEEKYPSYRKPTLEADDIMGILSTHPTLVPGKKIIVSEDKDMQTIPGWLYNPRKDSRPRLITADKADYFHMYQTLVGDTVDNYDGCPGVGDVNALEILNNRVKQVPYEHEFARGPRKGTTETRYRKEAADTVWEAMVSHFERRGLTEADAVVQAQVARICRASDYDFKKKEVKLWKPQ